MERSNGVKAGVALPRPDATRRLAPPRRLVGTGSVRPWQVAVGAAVLLHVLVGTVVLVRPPAFLARLAKTEVPPPPREAEVELVQNDMPASGDQPVGATGKDKQNATAQTPAAPPPVAPPPSPPAQAPPPAPNLVTAPDGEAPPPQPTPSAKPGPAQPAPAQVTQSEQQPTDAPAGAAPDIRLSSDDDDQGMSGGTADTPAAPAPGAHNRLPAYPRVAGLNKQEGTVDMVVQVAPDGSAAQVIVANSSGFPALDSAAVRAVQKWRFRAARDHGVAVASQVEERLTFVLKGP